MRWGQALGPTEYHGLGLAWLMLVGAATNVAANGSPPPPAVQEAAQLLQSEDPYTRQLGFLRLEALREPGAVDIITPYVDHEDPELRAGSLRVLSAIQGPLAIPRLLQALHEDRSPLVRRAALLGLEPWGAQDAAVLTAFVRALRDPSTEVRITAVDVVSRIDHPLAQEAILLRSRREQRRDVRRVLKLALRRLDRGE